jgi:exopolyphosphatase/guanosine-5'-triphosphate,3'-diphosphate pyrophosphatase
MRVAAIDCGTNSVRLLIADVVGDTLTDVARRMEIVRLGEGVDRTGRLSPEAIDRTAARCSATRPRSPSLVSPRPDGGYVGHPGRVNAADFRAMVRAVLGVDPEVISGDEEARLSFAGAVRGLDAEPPYLIVDIGGGSTEFVTGVPQSTGSVSVDIGCVRMTERHLRSTRRPRRDRGGRAGHHRPPSTGARGRGRPRGATLVGLAGSVTTVTALALGLPGTTRSASTTQRSATTRWRR